MKLPPPRHMPPASGLQGLSRLIGTGAAVARDTIARGLVAMRVSPNTLTILGLVFTLAAAVCLAAGGGDRIGRPGKPYHSYWPLYALGLLMVAGLFDMLDGAVANITARQSRFGAFLDSTIDRCSDIAIFAGLVVYFSLHENITYVLLSLLCMANALLISYTKARAENMIRSCSVGYWQRGERVVGLMIALGVGHIPTALWQLALSSIFTVLRRIGFTYRALKAQQLDQQPPSPTARPAGWRRVCLWRYPRGSLPYDIVTATNILILLLLPLRPDQDILRQLWHRLLS